MSDIEVPRTEKARAYGPEMITVYACHAPEEYFLDEWFDIPEEYRNEIEAHDGLPCGQPGGVIDAWCAGCRFVTEMGTITTDIEDYLEWLD